MFVFMIQHTGLRSRQYADRLEELIKTDRLAEQDGGTPEQWANESVALVKTAWGAGWDQPGRAVLP
jgi:hypothetical protein